MKTVFKSAKLLVVFCLILSLFQPMSVHAQNSDLMPCASYYLDAYNTYIYKNGGNIQIWFEVMGTGTMDEIGTLSIVLYESTNNSTWKEVRTFLHEDYDTMLIEDDYWHMDYVSYDGIASRYYKAYVCIWAGKNGGGDTRYMWATPI